MLNQQRVSELMHREKIRFRFGSDLEVKLATKTLRDKIPKVFICTETVRHLSR